MVDSSSGLFEYNGRKYFLAITIYPDTNEKNAIPIDISQIEEFEYTTEINQFFHSGSITCVDSHGRLDRLLGNLNSTCHVFLCRMLQEFDGQITIERQSKNEVLSRGFIIQNVHILERESDTIRYKIEITTDSILRCMRNINYSNYNGKKLPVTDIFKACCANAGFQVDTKTFDQIKSDVKLNYITNGNDNLQSIFRYLFNKMFYYSKHDSSLKFAFYNETTDKCQLFDLMNPELGENVYGVVLSLLNTQTEQLAEQEQTKIATITRVPRAEYLDTMFNDSVYKYDYEQNTVDREDFQIQEKQNYINNTPVAHNEEIKPKYLIEDGLNGEYMKYMGFYRRQSYWNCQIDQYGLMTKNLLKNNALLIETSGEILRKPSSIATLTIDRNIDEHANDDSNKRYEELRKRYYGLEGSWYTMRVHHIIQPNAVKYRQVLALVRNFNFIPKIDSSSGK